MNTFQVIFINEAQGLKETIEIPEDEYILDVAEEEGMDSPCCALLTPCQTALLLLRWKKNCID